MNAPIIVFAYNRPKHLLKTLTALAGNKGAQGSELYLFIDGPKTEDGRALQNEVKAVAESFKSRFASFHLTVSQKNKGLAASVIGGVTEVIRKHGKVIVVEDDAVASEGFLSFMNEALDFYQNDKTVWSVGGYTVPLQLPKDYSCDVIKTQRSSSYAWATWQDRWERVDWDVSDHSAFRRSMSLRRGFNRWGNDRSGMLDDQMAGKINSWAIRFDYAMYRNGMYNIVPVRSLIQSIGHDGSGTNNQALSDEQNPFYIKSDNNTAVLHPMQAEPDERIRREFCKPFDLPPHYRAKQYLLHTLHKR